MAQQEGERNFHSFYQLLQVSFKLSKGNQFELKVQNVVCKNPVIMYPPQGAPEADLARLELSRNIADYAILGDTKRGKADPSSRRAQYGTVQVGSIIKIVVYILTGFPC